MKCIFLTFILVTNLTGDTPGIFVAHYEFPQKCSYSVHLRASLGLLLRYLISETPPSKTTTNN